MIECVEGVELLGILCFQFRTYHACHLCCALHDHDLAYAVALCLCESVGVEREVVVEILCGVGPYLLEVFLTLGLLSGEEPSSCHVETAAHIVDRNIIIRYLHVGFLQNVDGFLVLVLCDERQGCLSQQATVGVAHTHSGFVHIQTFLLQVAKLAS